MPEGDTIHKVAGYMRPRMQGLAVTKLLARRDAVVELTHHKVTHVDAVGKHLLIHLGAWVLRVHLGMYGSWHHYNLQEPWGKPRWQASVQLYFAQEVYVCFNAQDVEILRPEGLAPSTIGHLGPDLLSVHCDLQQVLRRALAQPVRAPLIDLLLDQHISCGIGNVYKNEVLFMHRLHPLTPRHALDAACLLSLYATSQRLLRQNLGGWRRTTTYDRRVQDKGEKAPRLHIYGHRRCASCGGFVAKQVLGKHRRNTFWCPACQPEHNTSP